MKILSHSNNYAHRPKLTDAEIIETFPEVKTIIPIKLSELKALKAEALEIISNRIELIDTHTVGDDDARWFWRQWLKLNEGAELLYIERCIARLERQLRLVRAIKPPEGSLTDDMIEAARSTPIEDVCVQQYRRSSKSLLGLCPLHDERSASFHIYTEQNRCWCFGCNAGGDVIKLTMLLYDLDFKAAVYQLMGLK